MTKKIFIRRDRSEINRKQRKARWIRAKNLMRAYPDCAYNGDFYCNHVYDPAHPWCWVDFRFFHTRLKRYFAVAMTTLEYRGYTDDEEKAWDEADVSFPRSAAELWDDKKDINEWINYSDERVEARLAYEKDLVAKYNLIPRTMAPTIEVKDYGPVAVGVWTTVNKPYIDEHVIREWIALYRSLGEPTTPGFIYRGEEVEVVPQALNDRYANA